MIISSVLHHGGNKECKLTFRTVVLRWSECVVVKHTLLKYSIRNKSAKAFPSQYCEKPCITFSTDFDFQRLTSAFVKEQLIQPTRPLAWTRSVLSVMVLMLLHCISFTHTIV